MQEITLETFNAVQTQRKSKIDDIVKSIVASLKASKSKALQFDARDLYKKETAHYYNLSLALKASKEFNEIAQDFKFVMNNSKHANFDKLLIVKK